MARPGNNAKRLRDLSFLRLLVIRKISLVSRL
jgi:hypothetical protein